MPDIFDYPVLPEMPFLEELAEELEGTFHVIAHAGHERNRRFIRERQKYFRRRYGPFVEYVVSDVGDLRVIPAYDSFQELLRGNPSPAEIRQRCEECLGEYLIAEEPSEEYVGIFKEFWNQEE
jgi:hypothetical protein